MHYHTQFEGKKALWTFSANLVRNGLNVEFAKIIFNIVVTKVYLNYDAIQKFHNCEFTNMGIT